MKRIVVAMIACAAFATPALADGLAAAGLDDPEVIAPAKVLLDCRYPIYSKKDPSKILYWNTDVDCENGVADEVAVVPGGPGTGGPGTGGPGTGGDNGGNHCGGNCGNGNGNGGGNGTGNEGNGKGPDKDKGKDNASEHNDKGGNDGKGGKDRDGGKNADKGNKA